MVWGIERRVGRCDENDEKDGMNAKLQQLNGKM